MELATPNEGFSRRRRTSHAEALLAGCALCRELPCRPSSSPLIDERRVAILEHLSAPIASTVHKGSWRGLDHRGAADRLRQLQRGERPRDCVGRWVDIDADSSHVSHRRGSLLRLLAFLDSTARLRDDPGCSSNSTPRDASCLHVGYGGNSLLAPRSPSSPKPLKASRPNAAESTPPGAFWPPPLSPKDPCRCAHCRFRRHITSPSTRSALSRLRNAGEGILAVPAALRSTPTHSAYGHPLAVFRASYDRTLHSSCDRTRLLETRAHSTAISSRVFFFAATPLGKGSWHARPRSRLVQRPYTDANGQPRLKRVCAASAKTSSVLKKRRHFRKVRGQANGNKGGER